MKSLPWVENRRAPSVSTFCQSTCPELVGLVIFSISAAAAS